MSTTSRAVLKKKANPAPSPSVSNAAYQEVTTFGGETRVRSFSFKKETDDFGGSMTQLFVSEYLLPSSTSKKRKHRAIEGESRPNKKARTPKTQGRFFTMSSLWKAVAYVTTIASAIYIYRVRPPNLFGNTVWPVEEIAAELRQNIFQQNLAVEALITAINDTIRTEVPTALILTGNMGVGKTSALNVLSSTFPWQNRLVPVLAADIADKCPHCDQILKIAREPYWSLLVIDQCCEIPTKSMSVVSSLLSQARQAEAKLMVVIAFTHQSDVELNNFMDHINHLKIAHYHIPFQPANPAMVRECLLHEIAKQGLPIVEDIVNEFVAAQLTYNQMMRGNPGCKLIDAVVVQYSLEVYRPL